VLRLVLDSMRWWAERIGIDGFRFDLAPVLTRGPDGFDRGSAFLDAVLQDPVLRELKLIAEPWDIGPDGYRPGAFRTPFTEWNDSYRDSVRGFWRGDAGAAARLADGLLGSAAIFDHDGRKAWSSVNFAACHDGFTLADLTLYAGKRNAANGEGNRDGHNENLSDDFGVEGPSDDPAIEAARARRRRNLLATVLLSQGTPMLRAGDEIAQSQGGNNNAYCQDNETSWIDWTVGDRDLAGFVRRLVALRRTLPVLRQVRFLHGNPLPGDEALDVEWLPLDGDEGDAVDWAEESLAGYGLLLRDAGGLSALVALNRDDAGRSLALPDVARTQWHRVLDTAEPDLEPRAEAGRAAVAPASVALFVDAGALAAAFIR